LELGAGFLDMAGVNQTRGLDGLGHPRFKRDTQFEQMFESPAGFGYG
jgi:hypothetical protein